MCLHGLSPWDILLLTATPLPARPAVNINSAHNTQHILSTSAVLYYNVFTSHLSIRYSFNRDLKYTAVICNNLSEYDINRKSYVYNQFCLFALKRLSMMEDMIKLFIMSNRPYGLLFYQTLIGLEPVAKTF